jgi:hypothetical protein
LQPIKKIAFTALIVTKETTGLDNLYDDVGISLRMPTK